MNNKNTLIIFMKTPRLGTVKTRLQPQFTPEQSLALYKAMGEDLVSRFRNAADFDLQIHFWPPDAGEEMQHWLGKDLTFRPQRGSDLGEKMHQTFVHVFTQGYRKAAIIGSDLPGLDFSHIREALWQLEAHDVVLGPTDDGGYYLVALKTPQPELFKNVRWSTASVLPQTLENASGAGLQLAQLKQEADLDTYREVRILWEQLNRPQAVIDRTTIPRTAAVLAELFGEK